MKKILFLGITAFLFGCGKNSDSTQTLVVNDSIYLYEYPTFRAEIRERIKVSDTDFLSILIPSVTVADGFVWQKVLLGSICFYRPVKYHTADESWGVYKNFAYQDRARIMKEKNPAVYKLIYETALSPPSGIENEYSVNLWYERYRYTEAFQGAFRRGWQRMVENGDLDSALESIHSHGVPNDAIFLALIESSWYPHGNNLAGAAGYWQFIPGTASRFGLCMTSSCDERLDKVKSTDAACRYLVKLYSNVLSWSVAYGGSQNCDDEWHFVFSAYNRGEAKVIKTFRETRGSFSDYQKTFSQKMIFDETKNYVPKIFGARLFLKEYVDKNFVLYLKLPKTKADGIFYDYLSHREDSPLEMRPSYIEQTWDLIWKADQHSPFLPELAREKRVVMEKIRKMKKSEVKVKKAEVEEIESDSSPTMMAKN